MRLRTGLILMSYSKARSEWKCNEILCCHTLSKVNMRLSQYLEIYILIQSCGVWRWSEALRVLPWSTPPKEEPKQEEAPKRCCKKTPGSQCLADCMTMQFSWFQSYQPRNSCNNPLNLFGLLHSHTKCLSAESAVICTVQAEKEGSTSHGWDGVFASGHFLHWGSHNYNKLQVTMSLDEFRGGNEKVTRQQNVNKLWQSSTLQKMNNDEHVKYANFIQSQLQFVQFVVNSFKNIVTATKADDKYHFSRHGGACASWNMILHGRSRFANFDCFFDSMIVSLISWIMRNLDLICCNCKRIQSSILNAFFGFQIGQIHLLDALLQPDLVLPTAGWDIFLPFTHCLVMFVCLSADFSSSFASTCFGDMWKKPYSLEFSFLLLYMLEWHLTESCDREFWSIFMFDKPNVRCKKPYEAIRSHTKS